MAEINIHRAGSIYLSTSIFQLESTWTDSDEIWCEHYVIVGYHKLVLFFLNFQQFNINMVYYEREVEAILAPRNVGSCV
jgi:hypothetical protein